MATGHAAQTKPKTTADAMGADGLFRIAGTTGGITTAALDADHELQGRKNNAIGADEEYQKGLHEPPSMADFSKKATRESFGQGNRLKSVLAFPQ